MDQNTSSVLGGDPETKLSTLTEMDPKIDFMNSVDVEREIVGENGVRLILAEGSSDGDLSQWKGMPYEDYFRGQCRTMTRFYILLIVLIVVCVVPIALASILVVKPFVSTLNFRETTCHVVNVTDLGNRSKCLEVFVQFTDLDTGNNVTTVLYPNEDRLYNKCFPRNVCPLEPLSPPQESCSIDCFYNPTNYAQVIAYKHFTRLDLLLASTSLIPSVITLLVLLAMCIKCRLRDRFELEESQRERSSRSTEEN